jgi:hypothetical protein
VAARTAEEIVRALPAGDWIRHRVTEGEKGPREYEFVRLRVIENADFAPIRSVVSLQSDQSFRRFPITRR